ncbi:hypothetical protein MTO96_045597 [Rhipicephalus appendiculatus]
MSQVRSASSASTPNSGFVLQVNVLQIVNSSVLLNKRIFYTSENGLSGGPSEIILLDMFHSNMLLCFRKYPYNHVHFLHTLVRTRVRTLRLCDTTSLLEEEPFSLHASYPTLMILLCS